MIFLSMKEVRGNDKEAFERSRIKATLEGNIILISDIFIENYEGW